MERIQRDLGEATAEAAVATKGVRGIIGTGAEIAFDTLKDLNNKYNKVTDDYTKDVMKNIKQNVYNNLYWEGENFNK